VLISIGEIRDMYVICHHTGLAVQKLISLLLMIASLTNHIRINGQTVAAIFLLQNSSHFSSYIFLKISGNIIQRADIYLVVNRQPFSG
jgi:hypothetical protein